MSNACSLENQQSVNSNIIAKSWMLSVLQQIMLETVWETITNTSLKNIRSCTKWVWLCNFLDSSLWLHLNSATPEDILAPRPIQPSYPPIPAQDETRICTFALCQGSRQKDTRACRPDRSRVPTPLAPEGSSQWSKTAARAVGQTCSTALRHMA